jgi:membrane-bound metal-dependent hydrolase YbcI (DUF457 family)
MMASGHMATGALLGGITSPLLPSPLPPVSAVVLGSIAGAYLALVMDLDTRGKCYYLLLPVSLLLKPLLVTLSKIIYHLTRGPDDDETTSGHRMFTHQPAFAFLLALIPLLWTWGTGWEWWTAGVVLVGVWSHRVGDACTKHGVPVGLIHVLVRHFRDEDKVWVTVGLPHKLRFVTGGKQGRKRFGAKSKRVWDLVGERVVTVAFQVLTGGLLLATFAGYWPLGSS